MQLVIVRHGAAVERGAEGQSDEERPLTARGRERFREAARGLARVLPKPELLTSSPLVRARQTAEIAAEAWGGPRLAFDDALTGAGAAEALPLLVKHAGLDTLALFGHEPQLSGLLAYLIGLATPEAAPFKKGGATLVEVDEPFERGAGRLVWFLPPRILRTLGGGGGED